MSIIIVLKEGNTLILSTDSRMMAHNYSGVADNTQQKIFEIAPNIFFASSGRKMVTEFQVSRARRLAAELGTTDIQAIGSALARESLPCLGQLVERLRMEPDQTTRQQVSGESLLHGDMLVGRMAGGKLGYVLHIYRVQEGAVTCETEAYADGPRKIAATSGTPAPILAQIAARFTYDMTTWTDPLEQVSMRFLEAVKAVTPTIGGPWQVVRLDAGGAHWISQPPQGAGLSSELATATISAAVRMTSPELVISGSGWTINLDSTNGFKATKGTSTFKVNMATTTAQMYLEDTSVPAMLLCDALGMTISQTGSGSLSLTHSSASINNGTVNTDLDATGLTIVNGASTFTGTLAAAIAAGKSVKNGSIMN